MFYNVNVTTALLQTKLYVPPIRPGHVPRPRLIRHLDQGLSKSRALTLISAPAGYGKTTILVDWLRGLRLPVAWISVDKGDNEPARFFAYLFASLRNIDQEVAGELNQHLQAAQLPSPTVMMTALINDVAAQTAGEPPGSDYPFILVLDDYHAITEATIHESVDFLLERFPPGMHLVIATRQDPPLALSRLRGRGLITELRQDDLRFSYEESAQFLVEFMGLKPSTEEIKALNDRAEGWVAGIQLAALSMQGLDPSKRELFIDGFSGRHRFILDYLTDEVINRQTDFVQSFLLHTAILDRMCGDLCEAVLAGPENGAKPAPDSSAQELLEHLEASNLFLIPLDDDRRWYRYHQLFAELLRARLQESDPLLVPELHHRAAIWHEKNGFIAQAVHHELLSDDMGRAADLIGRAIMDFETWSRVEVVTFLEWMQALAEDVLDARPWLRLFKSRSLYVTGEPERARHNLELLEIWLDEHPASPDAKRLRGLVSADQASYAVVRGDLHVGITFARRTLAHLPEEDGVGRMRAKAILGLAYYRLGDVGAAKKAFSEAIDAAIGMGASFGVAPLMCNVAEIQIIQGKLNRALRSSEKAMRLGTVEGKLLASAGFAPLEKGKILYERNDLAAAESNFRQALELLGQGGITSSFGNVHAWLAQVRQAQGYSVEAQDLAAQAVQIAYEGRIERITNLAEAYQAQIWLAQGETGLAVQWAADYKQLEPTEYLREVEELVLAQVLLASEQTADALALLDTLSGPAEAAGRNNTVIQIAVLRALAFEAQGKAEGVLINLQEALDLAEPEGYSRVFLDQGLPMARLLHRAAQETSAPGYIAKLLAAFETETIHERPDERMPGVETQTKPSILVEPLTNRELEVLQLLAEGCTNKDIARRLVLSTHTVRSHTYNLYGKLGVHSRTQAVARARELNLLPSD